MCKRSSALKKPYLIYNNKTHIFWHTGMVFSNLNVFAMIDTHWIDPSQYVVGWFYTKDNTFPKKISNCILALIIPCHWCSLHTQRAAVIYDQYLIQPLSICNPLCSSQWHISPKIWFPLNVFSILLWLNQCIYIVTWRCPFLPL